jgi:ubiquinone/menaquinone biosynthesis C-methylase UbiE
MSLAGSFLHEGVARAYRHRPPYPPALFDALEALIVERPRRVLDLGAGDGALARPLAQRVDQVDAVEISPAMVAVGRQRPGGGHPNLTWHVEAAETLALQGPYALVTAGQSLHWMDWRPTLDRVNGLLSRHAMLALVDQSHHRVPWRDGLIEVIVKYSRNPDYKPDFVLADELARQGLFDMYGTLLTPPAEFGQTVDEYIEQFHSTASLARELMTPEEAAGFANDIAAVVQPHARDGVLTMQTVATLTWGKPRR